MCIFLKIDQELRETQTPSDRDMARAMLRVIALDAARLGNMISELERADLAASAEKHDNPLADPFTADLYIMFLSMVQQGSSIGSSATHGKNMQRGAQIVLTQLGTAASMKKTA